MSILYINEQGSTIGVEGGCFTVKQKNGMIKKIPKESLESITIFGNVSITTACYRQCLISGIAVNYFSTTGRYFGKLSSTMHIKSDRIKNQVYMSDDITMCLELSKKIVHAKISNQLVVLKRYKRTGTNNIDGELKLIEHSKNKIEYCKNIQELMGYEGNAAREYFKALSLLIRKEFQFEGRNRRPPRDPFNSMLSLGYTIVLYEIYNEIENRGLNPYLGFMHTSHHQQPSLASDMLEEWRAVIVDSTVMSLIQGNEIQTSDFYKDEETEGIYLTQKGMKIFVNKLEKKLKSNASYLCSNEKALYFRRGIYLQTLAFNRMLESNDINEYVPIYIR